MVEVEVSTLDREVQVCLFRPFLQETKLHSSEQLSLMVMEGPLAKEIIVDAKILDQLTVMGYPLC